MLVLCAGRHNEIRLIQWPEVDWVRKVLTVPAARMKGRKSKRKPHAIPLPDRAIEILEKRRHLDAPFADVGRDAIAKLNRAICGEWTEIIEGEEVVVRPTPHGWRSTFRRWAAAKGNISFEAAELALAHEIAMTKAQRAYLRGEGLLDERRILMARWADYLADRRGQVVTLRA